ncbi:MAG: hypothetical protein ACI9HX_000073 [Pseudoalteromonas tetraodonis]|jgi:hypothetical protein
MNYLKAFIAGFLATIAFHQGLLGLLHLVGASPIAPFNITATPPLNVPQFISLAFWGGIWGVPVWAIIARLDGAAHWIAATVIGAVGPSAVAMLIVFPSKGIEVTSTLVVGALLLNAAWGIGLALWMVILGATRSSAAAE